VLGPRTFEQFQEQLGTLDVTITDEDRARIDRVSPPGRVIVPYYLSDDFADFRPNQYWW
jgi:hypothetical protein